MRSWREASACLVAGSTCFHQSGLGSARPAVLRLITSLNLVVRGHSGPTQQRRTLCCVGSGCAPLFAAALKQRYGKPTAGRVADTNSRKSRRSVADDLVNFI